MSAMDRVRRRITQDRDRKDSAISPARLKSKAGARIAAPGTAKSQRRREDILRKATELFDRKGYANTSLDDIARAVGIAREGIYYYFKNRAEILLHIIEPRSLALIDGLKKIVETPNGADHARRLHDAVRNHLEQFDLHCLEMTVSLRDGHLEDARVLAHCNWQPDRTSAPTLLALHGLEGSSQAHYMRGLADKAFAAWLPIDLGPLERILAAHDYDPHRLLAVLDQAQATYGYLPVAALQHISHSTGAWYSEIYGIATSYPHLVFEPGRVAEIGLCRCAACSLAGGGKVRDALVDALGVDIGGVTADGAVRFVAADCGGEILRFDAWPK